MFKTFLTAAALTLTTLSVQAAPTNTLAADIVASQNQELGYFCEWITVYDYWGNWVTVWQCY